MRNFSDYFELDIKGHRELEFIDVPIDTDVKLFLDPGLIEAGDDEFSKRCTAVIKSFFESVFQACRDGNYSVLAKLLSHSSEPNETHLGNSVDLPRGRGASEQILLNVFIGLIEQGLFEREAVLHPCDVYVLAPNFDKDRMSDLLTNLLRGLLSEFTEEQCVNHGIPLNGTREGYYWDSESRQWRIGRWLSPVVNQKYIMLVPKTFVSRSYHFGTSSYIGKYLLEYRQKYHLNNLTEMCHQSLLKNGQIKIKPPTKKELKAKEFKGVQWKEQAIQFAYNNPDTIRRFGLEREKEFANGNFILSNEILDAILYPHKFQIA